MSDLVRISRAHYPVTVLGPGKRIGIWLQGCSIGCPGCLAKDTWPTDAGSLVRIDTLVEWCRQYEAQGLEGITISGGEPFEQPKALSSLLAGLHAWTDKMSSPVDYLCYSGNPFGEINKQHPEILSLLDTIIPEPFDAAIPRKPLRGSGNQPIIHLTDLGASRFAAYNEWSAESLAKRMQFILEGDSIWFIGIPERGDLDRLIEMCSTQGLLLKNVSW